MPIDIIKIINNYLTNDDFDVDINCGNCHFFKIDVKILVPELKYNFKKEQKCEFLCSHNNYFNFLRKFF